MFASSRCPTMVVGFTLLVIWDEKLDIVGVLE